MSYSTEWPQKATPQSFLHGLTSHRFTTLWTLNPIFSIWCVSMRIHTHTLLPYPNRKKTYFFLSTSTSFPFHLITSHLLNKRKSFTVWQNARKKYTSLRKYPEGWKSEDLSIHIHAFSKKNEEIKPKRQQKYVLCWFRFHGVTYLFDGILLDLHRKNQHSPAHRRMQTKCVYTHHRRIEIDDHYTELDPIVVVYLKQ